MSQIKDSSNKKRRHQILAACDFCRSKKTGCDGTRPSCARCLKRGTPCIYATLDMKESRRTAARRNLDLADQTLKIFSQVLKYLRIAPESQAKELLRHIRKYNDIISALEDMPGDLLSTSGLRDSIMEFDTGSPATASDAATPQDDGFSALLPDTCPFEQDYPQPDPKSGTAFHEPILPPSNTMQPSTGYIAHGSSSIFSDHFDGSHYERSFATDGNMSWPTNIRWE